MSKTKHTPTPWIETGSHDFRGADMALVGMVNPTVKQGKIDRTFIVKACNSHDVLVKALEELLRFCDDATLYEKENPDRYSPYIAAREALATVSIDPPDNSLTDPSTMPLEGRE